jgi:DNA-binding LacI/PurR family transcriptional regulator
VAKLALTTLLARIAEPGSEQAAATERMVPTELVVRESCRPR